MRSSITDSLMGPVEESKGELPEPSTRGRGKTVEGKDKTSSSSSGAVTPRTPSGGAQGRRFNRLVSDIMETPPAGARARGGARAQDEEHEDGDVSPARTVLAFGRECAKLPIDSRVEHIYRLIRQSTGALGGNGNTGAIYGELTMASMQKVVNVLIKKCGMDSQSRFIDVGSGLGKPNLHVAQDPAVRLSVGIELEHIRWQLAMYNLYKISDVLSRGKEERKLLSGTNFMAGDIDVAVTMDPFTHIYMYDLGFPPPLQQSIALKFNTSVHAQYLVSYRPPHRVIDEYGYKVVLVDQLPTSMHGSGESHMAYVYSRTNTPMTENAAAQQPNLKRLVCPRRPGFDEQDQNVWADKAFYETAKLAVGPVDALRTHCAGVVDVLLNSAKPKRERKPRVMADYDV